MYLVQADLCLPFLHIPFLVVEVDDCTIMIFLLLCKLREEQLDTVQLVQP